MILHINKDNTATISRPGVDEKKEILCTFITNENESCSFVHNLDIKITKNVNIDFMLSFIVIVLISKNKSTFVISILQEYDNLVSGFLKKLGFVQLTIPSISDSKKYYKYNLDENEDILFSLSKEFVFFKFKISLSALFYILTNKINLKKIVVNSYKNYLIMSFDGHSVGLIYDMTNEHIIWCGSVVHNAVKEIKNGKK